MYIGNGSRFYIPWEKNYYRSFLKRSLEVIINFYILLKKEKRDRRSSFLFVYLLKVVVLVVRGLLGLLLEFLDFVLILHLCRLAVDLVVVDHHYFRMMVGLVGFLGLF
jgi:hypothetical protein